MAFEWLDNRIKIAMSILAFIGTVASGVWVIDSRYVSAADFAASQQTM